MTGRSVLAAVLASALVAGVGTAQNTRTVERAPNIAWNALLAADTTDDSPSVQLWLESGPSYAYGSPVRVRFQVSDDAYVIVARVNSNGHLTLLYPSSRLTTAETEGGREVEVRGRRGPGAFYADDRLGGGFIFAVASYDPFVLTRLGIRDFDRYVTGTYVGRPTRVYVGDPHTVISRFVNMVSFSEASPFDYAVEYYNVDAPYFVTSAGYSSYCSGYNNWNNQNWYRPSLAERWDDDYNGYYGLSSFGCNPLAQCSAYGAYGFGYSTWFGGGNNFYPNYCYPQQQTNNPTTPTAPPGSDSLKVPRWLTDSVGGRLPDTVGVVPDQPSEGPTEDELLRGPNALRRMTTGTEGPRRPVVVADDPSDNSYAIPDRALRRSPMTIGQTRDGSAGAPIDRPDRRSASASGGPTIDWVRPPREVVHTPVGNDGGYLPRSPRERGNGNGIDRTRGNASDGGYPTYVNPAGRRGEQIRAEPPRYDPPTRTQGPRFDSPRPTERSNGSDVRYAEPPRSSGAPRFDAPRPIGSGSSPSSSGVSGGDRSSSGSAPSRAEHAAPPPRPAPAPVSPPASTGSGEKKPEKP